MVTSFPKSLEEVPSGLVVQGEVVVLSVVVELSVLVVLDELLDEVQDMEMKLKRNTEKIMSRCFTWFPIGGLGEPNIYHNLGEFTRIWGFYLDGV